MNSGKRITNVIIGVVMLLMGAVLILAPSEGLPFVALILSVSLVVYGVRMLVYYVTMARHMVGGRLMLYIAVIVLDFGVFVWTLSDIPKIYIVLYMVAIHAFSGAIDIMRGIEAKRYHASSWKLSFISGAVNIAVAILSIVFIRSVNVIVILYALGLIYSAITRIISAFRRTAIVYIR